VLEGTIQGPNIEAELLLNLTNFVGNLSKAHGQLNKTVKEMGNRIDRFAKTNAKASKEISEGWWARFGVVALGFTVAYRAMNAFEAFLRKLVDTFGDAIRESGELASYQAKLSMWYQMLSGTGESFSTVMGKAAVNMRALADASVHSLSSLEELTTGFDELGQAGLIVSASNTKVFADLVSFTKLVAQTTGSTTRQIRQEFQALAQGQIKTTDILARTLKRLGILSKEDIKDLRNMVNTSEILTRVAESISGYWRDVESVILRADPAQALQFWEKSLRAIIRETISLKSESKGLRNIFAETFVKHAERFRRTISREQLSALGLFIEDLNKILDAALGAFEALLRNFGLISIAAQELYRRLKPLLQVFVSFMILQVINKLLVGFGRGLKSLWVFTTGKWIGRLAGVSGIVLLAVTAFQTLEKHLRGLPKVFSDAIDEIKSKMPEFQKQVNKIWDSFKDKWKSWNEEIAAAGKKVNEFMMWMSRGLNMIARKLGVSKEVADKIFPTEWEVSEASKRSAEAINNGLRNLYGGISGTLKEGEDAVVSGLTKAWEKAREFVAGEGKDFAQDFLANLNSNIEVSAKVVRGVVEKFLTHIFKGVKFPKLSAEEFNKYTSMLAKAYKGLLPVIQRQRDVSVDALRELRDAFKREMSNLTRIYGVGTAMLREKQMELAKAYRRSLQETIYGKELSEKAKNEVNALMDAINKALGPRLLYGWNAVVDGLKNGLYEIKQDVMNVSKSIQGAFTSAFDGMSSAIADFVFEGKNSFADFAKSVLRMLTELSIRMMLFQSMMTIIGWFPGKGSVKQPGFLTKGGAYGGLAAGSKMHAGGVVGETVFPVRMISAEAFASAVRLHNGLRADEFPAILQRGETVLPRGVEPQVVPTYNVIINALDSQSFAEFARRNPQGFLGPILDLMKTNRRMRNTMRGVL